MVLDDIFHLQEAFLKPSSFKSQRSRFRSSRAHESAAVFSYTKQTEPVVCSLH